MKKETEILLSYETDIKKQQTSNNTVFKKQVLFYFFWLICVLDYLTVKLLSFS